MEPKLISEQEADLLPSAQVSANAVLSAVLPCMVKYKGHGHKLEKIAGEICTIRIAHAAYYLDYDKNVHVSELSLFEPHEHDVDSFNGHCQICGLYCR